MSWNDRKQAATGGTLQANREAASERLRLRSERDRRNASRPAYASFRLALIHRILDERLKPVDVAAELAAAAPFHGEIDLAEVRTYRDMGQTWQRGI